MNPKELIQDLEVKAPKAVIYGTFTLASGAQIITGYFDIGDSYLYCVTPRKYLEIAPSGYTMVPFNRFAGSIIEALKKSAITSMAVPNESDLLRYKKQANKEVGFEFYNLPKEEVLIPMSVSTPPGMVH